MTRVERGTSYDWTALTFHSRKADARTLHSRYEGDMTQAIWPYSKTSVMWPVW